MDYTLHSDRPAAAEVRRVLGELVDDCVARASSPPAVDVHDDVHEVRKTLKKARALLTLAAGHVDHVRPLRRQLRDVGRTLSAVRDDAAVVEAFDQLREELARDVSPALLAEIDEALRSRRDASATSAERALRDAARELEALRPMAARVAVDVDDPHQFHGGLARAARRSRKAGQTVAPGGDPARFHEWRKRAKLHRYQLELLTGGTAAGFADLLALTDVLGEIQDTTVLLERIGDEERFIEVGAALVAMRYTREVTAVSIGALVYGE